MKASLDLPLSESQKKFFILEFTKEMIRNSGEYIYLLNDILNEEEKEKKKKFINERKQINLKIGNPLTIPAPNTPPLEQISNVKTNNIPKKSDNLKKMVSKIQIENSNPLSKQAKQIVEPRSISRAMKLSIPEPQLPIRFQYLKPIPGAKEISLGKLDPLLQDPRVRVIECNGPGQDVLVVGGMGTKPTGIILSSEEIEEVINRFSQAAKIPVFEGVFKVVVGKYIFLAVISEIVGSKFTIRKMVASIPSQGNQMGQRIPIPQRVSVPRPSGRI